MAISAEQLNVILSARDKEFQRKMRDAERRVQHFKSKSNKNLGAVSKSFDGLSRAVRRLAPILAGAFTIGTINRLVNGAAQIGRAASVAGTGVEEFQRFAVGARTVGIEMDKVSDILKDVNDKIGDFLATGGGPMKDFFENIAPAVGVTADQFARLSGPEALQLYVSSLEKANLTQAEMTFYMEALANDATALLPVLRNNGRVMKDLGDEAERTGRILDKDAIEAARELEAKSQELSDTISKQLTQAILDNEEELRSLVTFITDTAIPAFSSLIAGIGDAVSLYNAARGITDPNAPTAETDPDVRRRDVEGANTLGGGDPSGTGQFYVDENGEVQEYGASTPQIPGITAPAPPPAPPTSPPSTKGSGGGGKSAASQVQDLADAYRDLIGTLDVAIGAEQEFNDAQRVLNEALASGAINQEQFNGALGLARERLAAAKSEASGLADVFATVESSMEDAFMSMIGNTEKGKDAFRSMAQDIIKELYRVLVVQQLVGSFESGGGGILGAAFGAFGGGGAPVTGNAAGGTVRAGVPSITGEHGRELFVPQVNGRVMTTAQTKAMTGNGGGGSPVQVNYHFQGGVTEADLARVLPKLVESTKREVVNAVQRGGSIARAFQ